MCVYLGVSRQGYINWFKNGRKKYKNFDNNITDKIKELFDKFKGKYGYPMLTLFLKKYYNLDLNPWITYRYMKIMNLKCYKKSKKPNYEESGPLRYNNILKRNFKSTALNKKWVTDVTYIPIKTGRLYLSVIKDLYNSEIVDWKLSKSPDKELSYSNLHSAFNKRKPKN